MYKVFKNYSNLGFTKFPAFVLALICLTFLYSCGSPKRLIYLQDDKADNIKTDQLVKTLRLQEDNYKLRAGDRLMLNVFSLTDERINFLKDKPEFELAVDNKGQIEVPVVGFIDVNGLTMREAEARIKEKSTGFLKNPSVSIKLLNFNFTVIGEVASQGSFVSTEPRVNLLEAIGKAGGLTENANRETIRVIRNENNSAKIFRVNLLEDNSITGQTYFLQPNDIVLVDPIKANSLRQERVATVGLVISIISSLSFIVYQVLNNN